MKVLTNLPFECFEPRETYRNAELVSYGPAHRTWVDGQFYPADVEFDPTTGTIEELFAALPPGFTPDLVLIYWPDQDPIPIGLERCPVPVVGVISDFNLTLPYVTRLWPFFDAWLTDRGGVDLFNRLSFQNTRYFCQFSFKAGSHRVFDVGERDIDVGFAGNLNKLVQRERHPWLERVARLTERGVASQVKSGIFGVDYGRFLSQCKLGFNRSVRSEMNLRAFEVPACGAVLLMEEENQEVREFFEPDEEVVLYGPDTFEPIVTDLLGDPERLNRIAQAGHRRVQDYRMSRRLDALLELVTPLRPCRPASTAFDRALGRGTAMLSSWASGEPVLDELTRAHRLAPEDARPLNALATALVTKIDEPDPQTAYGLLLRAAESNPTHAITARNLESLLTRAGQPEAARGFAERAAAPTHGWPALDCVLLEPCYSAAVIDHAAALRDAVLVDSSAVSGSAVASANI